MDNKKVSWHFVALLLFVDVLFLLAIWGQEDLYGQRKFVATLISQFIVFLLLLAWVLFFIGLSKKARYGVLVVVISATVIFNILFKVKELTGDFIPSFTWRWKSSSEITSLVTISSIKEKIDFAYPQFLGPNRNGTLKGIKLFYNWSQKEPKLVWKRSVGAGWSAFSILNNLAITQEQLGEHEAIVCYDLKTGKLLWSHKDKVFYESTVAGNGPRASPSLTSQRVFAVGATGLLTCLELKTGKLIWKKNFLVENKAQNNTWGKSCSPLLYKDLVIVSAGGTNNASLIAYHQKTGEKVWAVGNEKASYSSPTLAKLDGILQVLIFNAGSITAHNPKTGKKLWKYPWPKQQANVAQPLVFMQNKVLISSGYGVGSALLQVQRKKEKWSVATIWKSTRLKAKFANMVFYQNHVYGLDEGKLVCIELKNGKRCWKRKNSPQGHWKRRRYGHGQLILVENLLLIQAEKGYIALVEATPKFFKELSRFSVFSNKTWNSPVLVGPYLLVRNHHMAACYKLPLE